MNGIDENLLNRFMDDVCAVVKGDGTEENANSHAISKCKPLCTVEFLDGDEGVSFSVEIRGYVRDEDAYFIIGRVKGHDEKFFSRGFFTARGGHQTLYAMTHDAPRGMSIQQGVLIEIRNLVKRMIDDIKLLPLGTLQFLTMMSEQLDAMKVKVVVVKSEDNAKKDECNDGEKLYSRGKLQIKSERKSDDGHESKENGSNETSEPMKVPEDTIGEEFAKAVGNRDEKPDMGNTLDVALEGMEVYKVKKATVWGRIKGFFRRLLGLDRDDEALESLFDYDMNEREKDEKRQLEEEKEKHGED